MSPRLHRRATRKKAKSFELTLPEALAFAVQRHRAGHLADAELIYRRLLESSPQNADALHFLGVLLHQRDQSDEGLALIERSIALDPGRADRYNNLGNVLFERERFAEAGEAYRKAIDVDPEHAEAHNNLGIVFKGQGRLDEAAAAYERALELNPDYADAHNNFSQLLLRQGRIKEAVTHSYRALTLKPSDPVANKLLGFAYYTLGETDRATDVFRKWLNEEPGNPVARHLYAACSGHDVPQRASDACIETMFDSFAASFDAKLERLSYRAPGLIAEALARVRSPAKRLDVLDAGCGTGLCGQLLAPFASRLGGVDLSSRMLAGAKRRGVYDSLDKAELTAYLASHPGSFDVIVSADTLCYFGSLEPVVEAASRALRHDGLLIFTVEEATDDQAPDGYRINPPHGRYSHTRTYLRRTLQEAGLEVLGVESAILRMESGDPVAGLVVTSGKCDANDTLGERAAVNIH